MSSQDPKDPAAISQAVAERGLPTLDDQLGPAEPLSLSAQQALVAAALDAAFPLPSAAGPAAQPASGTRLWARRGFLLGGAAAILGTGTALWLRSKGPSIQPAGQDRAIAPSPAHGTSSPDASEPVTPDAGTAAGSSSTATPDAEASTDASSVTRPAAKKASEASDLLQRANERRRQQRFAEATALYQQIIRRYPRSDAAYVARVSAAMLYVERLRDPQRAQRLFQAALVQQPRGPLSEEARWGLAESFRALGQPAQERTALKDFLLHHPQALVRSQAERRLQLLERP